MYKNKKILAIIPARLGSKRIKQKNGKMLCNKRLFEYSIEVAKNSKYIDEILFSTDSQEWLEAAIQMGCYKNSLRPKHLAEDTTKTIDVILYEIENNNLYNEFSTVVLLQPTSPYRTQELLDNAIEKYFETEESLITVVKAKEHPIFMRRIKDKKLVKIIDDSSDIRTQDMEKIYRIVGSIYINNIHELNKDTILNDNVVPYEIEEKFAIDIDVEEDFKYAETILKENEGL